MKRHALGLVLLAASCSPDAPAPSGAPTASSSIQAAPAPKADGRTLYDALQKACFQDKDAAALLKLFSAESREMMTSKMQPTIEMFKKDPQKAADFQKQAKLSRNPAEMSAEEVWIGAITSLLRENKAYQEKLKRDFGVRYVKESEKDGRRIIESEGVTLNEDGTESKTTRYLVCVEEEGVLKLDVEQSEAMNKKKDEDSSK